MPTVGTLRKAAMMKPSSRKIRMFFFIIMARSMARPTAGIMPPAVEKPERTHGTWFCKEFTISSITKNPMPRSAPTMVPEMTSG